MVIREAHKDLYNELIHICDKSLPSNDADLMKHIMYQDMEYGGAATYDDPRARSVMLRFQNLTMQCQEKRSLEEAGHHAADVCGLPEEWVEKAKRSRLIVPLEVATCICVWQKYNPEKCKECIQVVQEATERIGVPTFIQMIRNH